MELLIFGHAGAKVLMFPTRDGRFWEYEKLEVVARNVEFLDPKRTEQPEAVEAAA